MSIARKTGTKYESENIYIEYMSSLTNLEASDLIGKTIKSISAGKEYICFNFTDGTQFIARGFTLDHNGNVDSLDTKLNKMIVSI